MPLKRWIEKLKPRMTVDFPDFLGRRGLCNAEAGWLVVVDCWLESRGSVVHIADREGTAYYRFFISCEGCRVFEGSTRE
jgi:hypothetical protein